MTTEASVLTEQRVQEIFETCLIKEGEETNDPITVEGVIQDVTFHRGRITQHVEEIIDMLTELPDGFRIYEEGGMSLLDAGVDKHGDTWTNVHRHKEQLVQLGMAIDRAEYFYGRSMWYLLRGDQPHILIY